MQISEATNVFGALAQETRLSVLRLLVEAGSDGLSAGAISSALNMAHNSMSFHLSQLKTADLIRAQKKGRSIIYQANFEQISSLIQFLLDDCCGSSADDCGLPCSPTSAFSDQTNQDKPRLKFTWSHSQ